MTAWHVCRHGQRSRKEVVASRGRRSSAATACRASMTSCCPPVLASASAKNQLTPTESSCVDGVSPFQTFSHCMCNAMTCHFRIKHERQNARLLFAGHDLELYLE